MRWCDSLKQLTRSNQTTTTAIGFIKRLRSKMLENRGLTPWLTAPCTKNGILRPKKALTHIPWLTAPYTKTGISRPKKALTHVRWLTTPYTKTSILRPKKTLTHTPKRTVPYTKTGILRPKKTLTHTPWLTAPYIKLACQGLKTMALTHPLTDLTVPYTKTGISRPKRPRRVQRQRLLSFNTRQHVWFLSFLIRSDARSTTPSRVSPGEGLPGWGWSLQRPLPPPPSHCRCWWRAWSRGLQRRSREFCRERFSAPLTERRWVVKPTRYGLLAWDRWSIPTTGSLWCTSRYFRANIFLICPRLYRSCCQVGAVCLMRMT